MLCVAGMAFAQEKNTKPQLSQVVNSTTSVAVISAAPSYAPREVKVMGDLDYGQTSRWVTYSARPRYRAFVFSAYGGERVEVNLQGTSEKAFLALADSTLNQVASGQTHLTVALPYRGPDLEVWYIVFRDADAKPARFAVRVGKTSSARPAQGSQDIQSHTAIEAVSGSPR